MSEGKATQAWSGLVVSVRVRSGSARQASLGVVRFGKQGHGLLRFGLAGTVCIGVVGFGELRRAAVCFGKAGKLCRRKACFGGDGEVRCGRPVWVSSGTDWFGLVWSVSAGKVSNGMVRLGRRALARQASQGLVRLGLVCHGRQGQARKVWSGQDWCVEAGKVGSLMVR